jgi:hypothetical protein
MQKTLDVRGQRQVSLTRVYEGHTRDIITAPLIADPQSAEKYGATRIPPIGPPIGSRLAISRDVEVQLPSYGDDIYLGSTGATGSSHRAHPLVLVVLLTTLFALVVWQGNSKATGSSPQVATADSAETSVWVP